MTAVGHHNIPLENIRTQLKILLAFLNNNYHEINPVIKLPKETAEECWQDFVQVFILLTLSKFSMLIWCVWLTFNRLNLLTVFSCGTISVTQTNMRTVS